MTDDRVGQIRARWSRDGGMGNPRSEEDYTDAGCRILARAAFDDVAWLLDERDRQAEIITAVTAVVDQARAEQHSSQSGRRMLGWVLDDLESALRRESS